jgi:hypothetical protein
MKLARADKTTDLPGKQATKFDWVIDLRTAKQIALTIPPEVRAERVIK